MIWSVVWIEAIVFMALFTAMVLAPALRGRPEVGSVTGIAWFVCRKECGAEVDQ